MARRSKFPTADSEVGSDHNSLLPPMTEEEKKQLFLSHKRLYQSLWSTKKEAINEFNRNTKLMKSQGTDVDDLKVAVLLESSDGVITASSDIARIRRVARMLDIPLQQDLFEDEAGEPTAHSEREMSEDDVQF